MSKDDHAMYGDFAMAKVASLAARRATQAELDKHLMQRLEQAIVYIEMGVDIAKVSRDLKADDSQDGLVQMLRTLSEVANRLEQLSPHLGAKK